MTLTNIFREKYVNHDEDMELKLDVPATPSYKQWIKIVQGFVTEIDENTVEDTCKLLECDFTNSSLTERIATKIAIMDVCKNYFEYCMQTKCGFPEITMDGTKEDWIKLKQKTDQLLQTKVDNKFGEDWGKALLPLLDRFIAAFDGDIDCVFWNSMIKRGAPRGESGAITWYSGWFNILFPIIDGKWNNDCVPYSKSEQYVKDGLKNRAKSGQSQYPMGVSSAPVTWNRLGQIIHCKFIAGFVGFKQDSKTKEICPNVAWFIGEGMSNEEIEAAKKRRW